MLALAILSLLLVVIDSNTRLLRPVRDALSTIVSPIYFVAHAPYDVTAGVGERLASRQSLLAQNRRLQSRLLEMSALQQQFDSLRQENARLRDLLGSQATIEADVLVAEIIGQRPVPYRHHLVLDKGSRDGVYVGQAVIDADGLFGQVIEVGRFASIVMTVTDNSHAVPVQVQRNNLRSIASGTGDSEFLELEYVPITADIAPGDLLVSSGMGGRFPPGYPVAIVTDVGTDPGLAYAQVQARPLAALDRSRHVLLVFPQHSDEGAVIQNLPQIEAEGIEGARQ